MVVTIALVVFLSSIVAFFAEEFGRMFKKIFAIPGAKLLLPLAFASWLIEVYEDWGLWLLVWFQALLNQALHKLSTFMPFERGSISLIQIIYLFLIGSLPIWIFRYRAIRKGSRKPQPFSYWLGLILWISATIMLVVIT